MKNSVTKQSARLIFFGTEDLSATTLQALIDDEWHISAVITKPDSIRGRKRGIEKPLVKKIAETYNISVLQPVKMRDITDELTKIEPTIGVLVSYGKIVPESIINLFPRGIINLHPSLLPLYRGSSPIEQAILNGDKTTGVSIMGLTKEMDAGPIFAQQVIQLSGNEYQKELYKKLGDLGSKLIVDLLPEIINGTITPQPQDNARITFAPLIQKEDARIVWVEKTALEIDRQIRAYNYWPQARGIIELTQNKSQEIELIITRAKSHASNSHLPAAAVFVENNHLFVGCKSGSLEILELKVPGKSVMSASDFIRGYIKNR